MNARNVLFPLLKLSHNRKIELESSRMGEERSKRLELISIR
jgi:hypothetical protein